MANFIRGPSRLDSEKVKQLGNGTPSWHYYKLPRIKYVDSTKIDITEEERKIAAIFCWYVQYYMWDRDMTRTAVKT